MSEQRIIRLFKPGDHEYASIAQVAASVLASELSDFEYHNPQDFKDLDHSFIGSNYLIRRYVATVNNNIVGYTQLFQIPWLGTTDHYWTNIRVKPEYSSQGIGSLLYQQLMHDLQELGAARAWIGTHETTPNGICYLERRGFTEVIRSWPFMLDIRTFEMERHRAALDRMKAQGITITTLAQECHNDPACLQKLYELHTQITRAIPLPEHPHPEPGLDWFERYSRSSPSALPEAYFIAKHGTRYVGESSMQRLDHAPHELHQKTTGVHTDYRGCGIALALKVATIQYALEQGYTHISTAVESNNPSMLAINAKLGFTKAPGMIVFEKRFPPG